MARRVWQRAGAIHSNTSTSSSTYRRQTETKGVTCVIPMEPALFSPPTFPLTQGPVGPARPLPEAAGGEQSRPLGAAQGAGPSLRGPWAAPRTAQLSLVTVLEILATRSEQESASPAHSQSANHALTYCAVSSTVFSGPSAGLTITAIPQTPAESNVALNAFIITSLTI